MTTATGANATATGAMAVANGDGATASGVGSLANGASATATGFLSNATGSNATATGQMAIANGNFATATGDTSVANGTFATALGQGSIANGATATALGQGSLANADRATAVGQGATVASGATGGSAFGQGAMVAGVNATAVGTGASAPFDNSSAIGAGAVTHAPNQMVFGTATNTYQTPGITSAASLAAQTGPTNFVTSDATGHLAVTNFGPGTFTNLTNNIAALNANVAGLQSQINNNLTEARAGTALAFATSGLHYDPRPGKVSVAAAFGNFQGVSGFAGGIGYALSDRFRFNAAFSGSPDINVYGVLVGGSWTLN
jgi:autotransporter adhesin